MISFYCKTWMCGVCGNKAQVANVICHNLSMSYVTNTDQMIVMNRPETADIQAEIDALTLEPARKIETGRILFVESHDHTLGDVVAYEGIKETRDETDAEKSARIADVSRRLDIATPEYIAQIRELYEYSQ